MHVFNNKDKSKTPRFIRLIFLAAVLLLRKGFDGMKCKCHAYLLLSRHTCVEMQMTGCTVIAQLWVQIPALLGVLCCFFPPGVSESFRFLHKDM